MSAITGSGWGSKHNWESGPTGWTRTTPYVCKDCGATFGHHYPSEPNIFTAMYKSGVPEDCVPQAPDTGNE